MTFEKVNIKTLSIVLVGAIALVGVIFLGMPMQAHAATIKSNVWKTVTVKKGATQTLAYTMPAKGYINVSMKCTSSVTDWGAGDRVVNRTTDTTVSVKKGKKVLDEFYDVKVGSVKKSFAMSYKKGTKITVKLSNTARSVETIKVKVALTKKTYMETESNNAKAKANAIKLGKSKTLTAVCNPLDWDWYKFKAPSKGTYAIQMRCTKARFKPASMEYESVLTLVDAYKAWKTVEKVDLEKGAIKTFKAGSGTTDGMVYQVRIVKA